MIHVNKNLQAGNSVNIVRYLLLLLLLARAKTSWSCKDSAYLSIFILLFVINSALTEALTESHKDLLLYIFLSVSQMTVRFVYVKEIV